MKNITIIVKKVLLNLPIISVGFVKILSISIRLFFKTISDPITINTEKKEKITKLNNKLKFPILSSLSFFTYLEKSPKLTITIEKYAKIVPAIEIIGKK